MTRFDIDSVNLMLTTRCNSNCKYCMINKLKRKDEDMSIEVLDMSLKFIYDNVKEGVEICLFGGEPLIRFDLISRAFSMFPYLNYVIPTNGILMDNEKFEFFRKHRDFFGITFSLDGTIEEHSSNRGEFPDIKMLSRCFCELNAGVRMTVINPLKMHSGVRFLSSIGAKRVSIGIPFFYENIKSYKEIFNTEALKISSDELLSDVEIKFDNLCSLDVCRAGSLKATISSDGRIFPCEAFLLRNEYCIGDVISGIDDVLSDKFISDMKLVHDRDCPCIANQVLYEGYERWMVR